MGSVFGEIAGSGHEMIASRQGGGHREYRPLLQCRQSNHRRRTLKTRGLSKTLTLKFCPGSHLSHLPLENHVRQKLAIKWCNPIPDLAPVYRLPACLFNNRPNAPSARHFKESGPSCAPTCRRRGSQSWSRPLPSKETASARISAEALLIAPAGAKPIWPTRSRG